MHFNRYSLVHRGDDHSKSVCSYLNKQLETIGLIRDDVNPELVIYVGGDGTLLHAFQHWIKKINEIAFTGIHTGTLGFSTDYTAKEIDEFIYDLQYGSITFEEKRFLEVKCMNDKDTKILHALNEVRVENIVRTQEINVFINDEYFETFRGNGMCVSGQYGSTAYNRSIGGAVIFPGLDLLQMTEISGIHHRHARSLGSPLILNPNTIIRFKHDNFKDALLCYDHLHIHLDEYFEVEISSYSETMRFAHFNKITHLERLHSLF